MLDVVVVLVAPLDTLLCAEVLVRPGALLRVTHLVVEGRAGAFPASVRRPAPQDGRKKPTNQIERCVIYNSWPRRKIGCGQRVERWELLVARASPVSLRWK